MGEANGGTLLVLQGGWGGGGEMVLAELSRALNPNGNAPINHKRETIMLGRAKKW